MFKPWIGDNYWESSFRILVLGESHYGEAHLEHGYELEEKTILCIQEQIDNVWRHAFYTKIVSTFLGHRPSLSEKKIFWHQVAYHNLITEPLKEARTPPSQEQWATSIATLPSVLEDLRPDYCVCLGFRMWPHLERAFDFEPVKISADPGECGVVFSPTYKCALHGIKHPSGGFSSNFWHRRISDTLDELMDNKAAHTNPLPRPESKF